MKTRRRQVYERKKRNRMIRLCRCHMSGWGAGRRWKRPDIFAAYWMKVAGR